jgi:hypothetical protein
VIDLIPSISGFTMSKARISSATSAMRRSRFISAHGFFAIFDQSANLHLGVRFIVVRPMEASSFDGRQILVPCYSGRRIAGEEFNAKSAAPGSAFKFNQW